MSHKTDLIAALRLHVYEIAGKIGERNVHDKYEALGETVRYITQSLEESGLVVQYEILKSLGKEVCNVYAEIPGCESPGNVFIVGSHYDTVSGSPGANDNTSAIAANLILASELFGKRIPCTVRFVFFVNEEAPYFMTDECGSAHHALQCRQRGEHVAGMISLETMGYYTDEPDSQTYPFPANGFPTVGNFIAIIANEKSAALLNQVTQGFKAATDFPVVGLVAPPTLHDACRSDHFAFWTEGFPALMVTDTANFRYEHYHSKTDTPDKLNYEALAKVVYALSKTIEDFQGTYFPP